MNRDKLTGYLILLAFITGIVLFFSSIANAKPEDWNLDIIAIGLKNNDCRIILENTATKKTYEKTLSECHLEDPNVQESVRTWMKEMVRLTYNVAK